MSRAELIAAVDAEFETLADGMERWPDPHPTGEILDEEYSRTTNPERYRIVSARCQGWLNVLTERGLCRVERGVEVAWETTPAMRISRVDRAIPIVDGALPLVIARTSIDVLEDFGVVLGFGEPAVLLASLPRCGCDACDGGSQYELDEVDRKISAIVTGTFRRLSRRGREIIVEDDRGWSGSGSFDQGEGDAIIADPKGWSEVSGEPWGVGG